MNFFAGLATRAPRYTLGVTVVLIITAALFGPSTPNHLANSETEFFSHDTQSYRAAEFITLHIGLRVFPNIGVIFPAHTRVGSHVIAEVDKVATLIPTVLYSQDRRTAAVVGYIRPRVSPGPAAARLAALFRPLHGVSVGGPALARQQFIDQVKHDFIKAEIIVFPLVFLLTFIVFRSAIATLLPVLTGGLTIGATFLGLRIINTIYPISILSLNVVASIALGLSLDYSILLVARYREELSHNVNSNQAARISVLTAGRTVAISSTTVAAAFASLLVFPIQFFRSVAVSGILAAIIAGLISMVALPALFSVLGYRINALAPKRLRRSAERTARPAEQGFWYRLARFVITRPAVVALVASCSLLAMSAPVVGMRLAGFDVISHSENADLYKVEERFRTEFSFPPLDDIVVLLHGSNHTMRTIQSQYLEKLPDVATGEIDRLNSTTSIAGINVTGGPFSNIAKRLIHKIRAMPVRLAVTGATAELVDTTSSLQSHLPLEVVILLATTLISLIIATGSAILPFKAIVMNMFSLAAAFGALVFIFQDGRLEGLLEYRGVGAIYLIQPFIICTAAFGILTDYSVFMLTRIKEGWDSGLSNNEAIALGVERTGRIITAAALLFCVTIGALVTAHLIFVKEIGFGLAVAIAIDATIVRAFLVPSLMTLLSSWNWWPETSYWHRLKSRRHPGAQRDFTENS